MESLRIVLLCIAAAIAYGICHDNVTVRISPEYFTIGHPPIFGGTENPTLLAFGWGVIATWWVGVGLGVPAAVAARVGARPKMTWRRLRMPLIVLMIVMAAAATANGIGGYFLADLNRQYHPSDRVAAAPRYVAAAHAHGASYFVGFAGGLATLGWIWWRRGADERALLRAEIARLQREREELLAQLRAVADRRATS